jgi:hypothetical protein
MHQDTTLLVASPGDDSELATVLKYATIHRLAADG